MILCIEPNERRPGGGSKRGGLKILRQVEDKEKKRKELQVKLVMIKYSIRFDISLSSSSLTI